ITNTLGSTLHRLADKAIVTKAGEEKAIAATKSYIAQLVSIAYLYSVYANKNLESEILDLPNKIYEIFSMEGIYKKYGEMLNEKIIILGSGILYPTALEASLKLKETANVLSEAYPSREFLHGPMQILDKNTDVIILGNSEDEMQVVKKITDYESKIIRVCEDCEIKIPVTNEILKPILYIIPIQFMAFYKALKKGLNPDKPEKLVKVVRE
ncbi:MAG: SIS domain-containing protein, partial [Saccharolobus sp.]